jgi:hypothetical protein
VCLGDGSDYGGDIERATADGARVGDAATTAAKARLDDGIKGAPGRHRR